MNEQEYRNVVIYRFTSAITQAIGMLEIAKDKYSRQFLHVADALAQWQANPKEAPGPEEVLRLMESTVDTLRASVVLPGEFLQDFLNVERLALIESLQVQKAQPEATPEVQPEQSQAEPQAEAEAESTEARPKEST